MKHHEGVQHLFRSAAEAWASEIALDATGRQVSYAELEARSNRWANFLARAGCARETRIAILGDDTVEVVTAILATLKTGGIFVPLDVSSPAERLRDILTAVRPGWILAESGHLAKLVPLAEALGEARILEIETPNGGHDATGLDVDRGLGACDDATPIAVELEADAPAYVFFTSGSTGVPKGIVGRFKAIDHFIRWEIETLEISRGTRVSQLTAPSFDAFLRDVFVPLCAGGTVCIPEDRGTILDARRLRDWIDSQGLELIHCVPSLFRSLLQAELEPELFPELRHVLLAGEVLQPADVRRWTDVFGSRIQLINLYGSSETTMTKFFHRVRTSDGERSSIPIGRPMPGAAAVVVDRRDRPCPPGEVGEILVRTPYRSLGYLDQPELTARAFVRNPFSDDPEDLVYRTGDFGRLREDGDFEFIGRRDHQVKVRGVRVELGAVESHLREVPGVLDAAVLARQAPDGDTSLVAYVVLSPERDVVSLRESLAGRLGEAMVPSVFAPMESLPRTITGKVDRRALAALPVDRRADRSAPPRTPIEEAVAAVFAEITGLGEVGLEESLFEIGGHSLSATRVAVRLRKLFEVEIPVQEVLRHPTVAALAARVEAAVREGAAPKPPLTSVPRDGALPASFSQERFWRLAQEAADRPTAGVPHLFNAVRLEGALDVEALKQALGRLAERHEVLRTVLGESGRGVEVVGGPPAFADLAVHDLRHRGPEQRLDEMEDLILEEVLRPFDLAAGPLGRAALLRLDDDTHALVVVLHQVVADGWSIAVLFRELVALYRGCAAGESVHLPELELQYPDYAVWQRRLAEDALGEERRYWRGRLVPPPAPVAFPAAGEETPGEEAPAGSRAAAVSWAAAVGRQLGAETAEGLRKLSRDEGVTLSMTLLAAFKALVHRRTGARDVLVTSPLAQRGHDETEAMVGPVVNHLALRTDLSGVGRFRELLARVRAATLEAYAHQDLPFEVVLEENWPEVYSGRSPEAQLMYNFQRAPVEMDPDDAADLALRPLALRRRPARCDLALAVLESSRDLSIRFDYRCGWMTPGTAEAMLAELGDLLDTMIRDPDTRLGEEAPGEVAPPAPKPSAPSRTHVQVA